MQTPCVNRRRGEQGLRSMAGGVPPPCRGRRGSHLATDDGSQLVPRGRHCKRALRGPAPHAAGLLRNKTVARQRQKCVFCPSISQVRTRVRVMAKSEEPVT